MANSPRLRALPLAAGLVALVVVAPRPQAAVSWDSTELTAPIVGVVALLAWGCLGWLLLVATLSSLADLRVRGVSWLAQVLVARLAPASVRAAVALAVGGTLMAGTVAPAWASAQATGPVVPAPVTPLDWPRQSDGAFPQTRPMSIPTSAPTSAPSPLPTAAPSPLPTAAQSRQPLPTAEPEVVSLPLVLPDVVGRERSRPTVTRTVIVRPGDSLWSIARRSLTGTPTDRRTAETWPLWWSANRQLIGDNPHLIRPGTPLNMPT